MLKYILLVLGLMLCFAYPWILLLAALYLFYLMLDIDKDTRALKRSQDRTRPTYGSDIGCGMAEDQPDKNCKPGFRDDPEWQARSAAIRNHIKGNKKSSETELNDENNATEPIHWTKKR